MKFNVWFPEENLWELYALNLLKKFCLLYPQGPPLASWNSTSRAIKYSCYISMKDREQIMISCTTTSIFVHVKWILSFLLWRAAFFQPWKCVYTSNGSHVNVFSCDWYCCGHICPAVRVQISESLSPQDMGWSMAWMALKGDQTILSMRLCVIRDTQHLYVQRMAGN